MTNILDISIASLHGEQHTLRDFISGPALIVNVASECGLTKQYTELEALYQQFKDKGFAVIGIPCNQFGQQEPGTPQEIEEFTSQKYGVTFPLLEKIDVNGENRHPLYQELTTVPNSEGEVGDITWNFEKFVVDKTGEKIVRFTPKTTPDDPRIIAAIEEFL